MAAGWPAGRTDRRPRLSGFDEPQYIKQLNALLHGISEKLANSAMLCLIPNSLWVTLYVDMRQAAAAAAREEERKSSLK